MANQVDAWPPAHHYSIIPKYRALLFYRKRQVKPDSYLSAAPKLTWYTVRIKKPTNPEGGLAGSDDRLVSQSRGLLGGWGFAFASLGVVVALGPLVLRWSRMASARNGG